MSHKGIILEHRLVMAESLGRPLTSKEVVHHKDGNPLNNSISNLYLTSYQGHNIITQRDTLRRKLIGLKKHIKRAKKELYELENLHNELLRNI